MKRLTNLKRLGAMALAVFAVAVASQPPKADALGFPNGDLAFVVYGGDTEYYRNLGSASAVLDGSSITTVSLTSQELSTVQTGASLGLKYSLLGISSDALSFNVGSQGATISSSQKGNTFVNNAADAYSSWQNQHGASTGGPTANNPSLTPKPAAYSFTSMLGSDGSLGGFMGFNTASAIGQALSIFRITSDPLGGPDIYTRVASAVFSAQGMLTVTPSAVPVPAAVVLFGTGLIGLVGIARRSLMRKAV